MDNSKTSKTSKTSKATINKSVIATTEVESKTAKDTSIKILTVPPAIDVVDEFKPKRLIIKEAIAMGGATRENLMEIANVSAKSLASQFSYLRLMGFYPFKKEDDTYAFMTEVEWLAKKTAIKANRKEPVVTDPVKKLEGLDSRIAKLKTRVANEKKLVVDPDSTKAIQLAINALTLKLYIKQRPALATLVKNMPKVDASVTK